MNNLPWRIVIAGLVVGLAAGLYYAWVVNPVDFVDVAPFRLAAKEKQDYVYLIAEAYTYDHDLGRAQTRLTSLGESDLTQLVSREADAAYLRGDSLAQVHALAVLAKALGGNPAAVDLFNETQGAQPTGQNGTPTSTFEAISQPTAAATQPTPSPTIVHPTRTPTPELIHPDTVMNLISFNQECRDTFPGHIEVYVFSVDGSGIPGVRVEVDWAGEKQTFVTGMKPEFNIGYADFEMVQDRTYAVTLVGLSDPVVGLQSRTCRTDSGKIALPSFELVFQASN